MPQDASHVQARVDQAGAGMAAIGWFQNYLDSAGRRKLLAEAMSLNADTARKTFPSWSSQHAGLLFCMNIVTRAEEVTSSYCRYVRFVGVTSDPCQIPLINAKQGSFDNLSNSETSRDYYFWAVPPGRLREASRIVGFGLGDLANIQEARRPGVAAVEFDPSSGPIFPW